MLSYLTSLHQHQKLEKTQAASSFVVPKWYVHSSDV